MSGRILLVLGQSPFDPASGAARSMRTICAMLAGQGFEVRGLATTVTEQADPAPALGMLREMGLIPRWTPAVGRSAATLELADRGVDYTLLDTGSLHQAHWPAPILAQFDRAFERELDRYRPHMMLTYGDAAHDRRRRDRAQQRGCKVVFSLHNLGYLHTQALQFVDALQCPSEYLAARYRQTGRDPKPMPLPLDLDEVIAPSREPIFITCVNPSIEKGVMFLAQLAEQIGVRRPDIPLLAVEGRGTGRTLVEAGLAGGFDLRRHENLMLSPPVGSPRDIFAATRVLLAPSVVDEAAGRVAVEALVNGAPPIVSDRGGLAEVCNGGGFVLPLPTDLTMQTRRPVEPPAVEPWFKLIQRLADDESLYADASRRALKAGSSYYPAHLAPRYAQWFEQIIGGAQAQG